MIFYFSGTGNSRYVAEKVAQATGDRIYSINDHIKKGKNTFLYSKNPLVFVTPVYAWRIPRVVERFIERTTFEGARQAYFLATCGTDGGAAARYAQKLCRRKDFIMMGLQSIPMPENYLAMYTVPGPAEAAQIIQDAAPLIGACARIIAAVQPLPAQPERLMDWFKSAVVNPLFYSFRVNARGFRVTEPCVACGQCARLCPLNNVRLEERKPVWGEQCTHCMSCIARCPEEAIEYGRNSEGQHRHCIRKTTLS